MVQRLPTPEATRAGIILPARARELPQLAKVIAIGPKNPENIKAGNLVLLMKFAGDLWECEDGDYYIMLTSELLAVVS